MDSMDDKKIFSEEEAEQLIPQGQITLREYLEDMGNMRVSEALTPETGKRIINIQADFKEGMDQFVEVSAVTLEKMLEASLRFEKMRPLLQVAWEAHPKNDPFLDNLPVHLVTLPIQYYLKENSLEEVKQETIEAHRLPFLQFFHAFVDEWKTLGGETREDESVLFKELGDTLRRKGLIKGETTAKADEVIQDAEMLGRFDGYAHMLQGPLTNAAARARITRTRPGLAEVDIDTDIARIIQGRYTITLDNFSELTKGLNDTAHMLFDALIIRFTSVRPTSGIIGLPLRDYMEMRGLKDEKEARKQINEGLEAIKNCKISGPKGYGENKRETLHITFYGGAGIYGIRNSIITFSIGDIFYNALLDYAPMYYPVELLKIDTSRNKHAFSMGRYIYEQKRINAGKKDRENIIKIKSLLGACPNLPRYQDLDKSKGEITRKIIDPFMNNLNHLEDRGLFTWKLCHSKGDPLTAEEETAYRDGGMTYALFETLYVMFDFIDYPSQARLVEIKGKHTEARRKAKAAAERKKLKLLAEKEAGIPASERGEK